MICIEVYLHYFLNSESKTPFMSIVPSTWMMSEEIKIFSVVLTSPSGSMLSDAKTTSLPFNEIWGVKTYPFAHLCIIANCRHGQNMLHLDRIELLLVDLMTKTHNQHTCDPFHRFTCLRCRWSDATWLPIVTEYVIAFGDRTTKMCGPTYVCSCQLTKWLLVIRSTRHLTAIII